MDDYAAISNLISRVGWTMDMKDWEGCRACFGDEIETDYSDFRGEPPQVVKADDYVALRKDALSEIKTQHLSGNYQITINGDEAVCLSHAVIFRFAPNSQGDSHYDTHAYYTHTLKRTPDGWKITKVKQNVLWSTGNPMIHGIHRKK